MLYNMKYNMFLRDESLKLFSYDKIKYRVKVEFLGGADFKIIEIKLLWATGSSSIEDLSWLPYNYSNILVFVYAKETLISALCYLNETRDNQWLL